MIREYIVSRFPGDNPSYLTVVPHALNENTPTLACWTTPMENQQPYGINYPIEGFQEPLGPGYYSDFQDWQPGEETSTREFSFTPSRNPSFDLGPVLPGSELPSEPSTLPHSISDDSKLSPPKIEKVLHMTFVPLDRRYPSTNSF
jgi:hypothetical protein